MFLLGFLLRLGNFLLRLRLLFLLRFLRRLGNFLLRLRLRFLLNFLRGLGNFLLRLRLRFLLNFLRRLGRFLLRLRLRFLLNFLRRLRNFLLRLRFLRRLDGFSAREIRFDQLVGFRVHAAETILDFYSALVQKVDDDLLFLIEFFRHVKDSKLDRF